MQKIGLPQVLRKMAYARRPNIVLLERGLNEHVRQDDEDEDDTHKNGAETWSSSIIVGPE